MKEKILHTTTPKARKEHTCKICGKLICKGERYLNIAYKVDGKLMNRKTHFGCSEKKEKQRVSTIPGVPVTEEQFKKQVHDDTLMMLETFTFKENMNIAFVPLIITEVAWLYAMKVVKYAADNRITDTVKLSRAVRALREQYLSDCSKDLDSKHIEKMEKAGEEFVKKNQMDFVMIFYSLNNELKKHWSDYAYLDMKTDACIAMIMLKLLKEHNSRMDELMASKLGGEVPSYRNPINEKLWDCMDAYAYPCKLEFTGHVETSMKIIRKKFDQIDFEVK